MIRTIFLKLDVDFSPSFGFYICNYFKVIILGIRVNNQFNRFVSNTYL